MDERWRRDNWPPLWPQIHDPAVRRAMAGVPRHCFVPEECQTRAYLDMALPIGHGQTISQPYIVALMTQALCLHGQSRVLEIGTGSGYQTAVLAQITPHVWSIEARAPLASAARRRLADLGVPAQLRAGDGCQGWPECSPYDGILVAAAAPALPPALVAQLAPGGRLVMPLEHAPHEQMLWVIHRTEGGLRKHLLGDVCFVPLLTDLSGAGDDPSLDGIRREIERLFPR
jgi:protein-L-isoaspartate(D-aspartate) O-methyltransferase